MSDTWESNEYAKRARGRLRDAAEIGPGFSETEYEHRKAELELQIGALMLQERSVIAEEAKALGEMLRFDPETVSVDSRFWDKVEEAFIHRVGLICNGDAERVQRIIHGQA